MLDRYALGIKIAGSGQSLRGLEVVAIRYHLRAATSQLVELCNAACQNAVKLKARFLASINLASQNAQIQQSGLPERPGFWGRSSTDLPWGRSLDNPWERLNAPGALQVFGE